MSTQMPDSPPPPRPEGSPLQELLRQGRIAWRLFTDRRVPLLTKLIPVLAVVYLVSPIDVVPDFLPIAGQADDLAILLLAVRFFIEMAPKEIVRELDAGKTTVSTTYRMKDDE